MSIARASEGPVDQITADDQKTRKQWLSWLGKLEQDAELDRLRCLQIDGLDVWPIIKATIIMGALNRNQRTRFVARAPVKTADATHSTDSPKSTGLDIDCDVLFLANTAPAIEIDGILLNPHLDPLRNTLRRMGIRTLTAYYDSAPERRVCAFPSISISEKLGQIETNAPSRRELRKLQELRELLSTSLADESEIDEGIQKDLVRRVQNTLALRFRYQQIFDHNPALKCLFVTNYYGPHGWGAVSAAKSLGIPTVDIQHGLQGRYHHAYSWPELKNKSLSCVPDYFLCWTKHDQKNLDRYPLTRGRSEIIGPGHFQLEKLVEERSGDPEPTSPAFNRYSQLGGELLHFSEEARSEGRRIAGVFLQYKEDERWLEALRDSVSQKIELWVRRHPGVRRLDPNPGKMAGIQFVDHYPLTSVLKTVDVVVTGYSSVGIEASHLGLPTVAYSPLAIEFLEPYCASAGLQITRGHPTEVASAISWALSTRAGTPSCIPDINSIAKWVFKLLEEDPRRKKYIAYAMRYFS